MRESVSKIVIDEVYNYLVIKTYENQYVPSYGEISADLHRSKSSICYAIRELERLGYIKVVKKGGARAIIINALEIQFKNKKDMERLCLNAKV